MLLGRSAICILGGLALVVPDSFAVPILILFLSGVVTFAGWLVKSNQNSLGAAKEAANAATSAAKRLEDLYVRVTDLEKWRVDELMYERDQRRRGDHS